MQYRLLIFAPDPLARAGLAALFAQQTQVIVVGQSGLDENVVAQVAAYHPDVILCDLGWQMGVNLTALAALTDERCPVVALAAEPETAAAIWSAGVDGLLLRNADVATLTAALVAAMQGLVVLDPGLTGVLRSIREDAQPLPEALTPRELEVLHGLAEGLPNKQIANRLAISEHTIKFHVNAIMGKLGAQSRTEAVVRATRAGLILL